MNKTFIQNNKISFAKRKFCIPEDKTISDVLKRITYDKCNIHIQKNAYSSESNNMVYSLSGSTKRL